MIDEKLRNTLDLMNDKNDYIEAAHRIIISLGFTRRAQQTAFRPLPAGLAEPLAWQGVG